MSARPTLMNLAATVAFASVAGAQPVSYSRQIAPILAMNCNACHGANPESAAGGLSTRTWADLKKGGNLGSVIIPADPERSALYQFVSGARGEAHRMPLGGAALTAVQLELIRTWILEGGGEDSDTTPKYRLELPSLRLDFGKPVRIRGRVPATAYVELEVSESPGRTLYREGGAVKLTRDQSAIGAPGEWIEWTLRRASTWPAQVRLRLTIAHAASEPSQAVVTAAEGPADREFAGGKSEVRVLSSPGDRLVLQRHEHLPAGIPAADRWEKGLAPGLYVLHVRHLLDRREAAILFRAAIR